MNGLMIKSLAFSAILIIATIAVVMSLNIDIVGDSVNAITMAGAIAIAVLTSAVSVKYINQMKTDTATGELASESWDGIGEYKNELPSGWAYSFLATFMWSMWYGFFGYPINAYSQIGEYNEEVKVAIAKFEKNLATIPKEELAQVGESIFFVHCAPCHGGTGDGLSGQAEDLTVNRSKENVLNIINKGQNALHSFPGGMPPGMASGKDAEEIATYVASGFTGEQPAGYAVCLGCHGANGEGMPMVGPRINGYDLQHTLAKGKKGHIGLMPAFPKFEKLGIKPLRAYLNSIQTK